MSRQAAIACALVVLAVASPAWAQLSGQKVVTQHMAKGVAETRVGDWVTYKLTGGVDQRTYYWRAAVVGEEKDRHGRDAVWVELDLGTHHAMKAPLMQMKLLVARNALQTKDPVTRMYMAWGVEKARELDDASLVKIFGSAKEKPKAAFSSEDNAHLRKIQTTVRAQPEQRLMTLAGTVSAVPVEVRVRSTLIQRVWVSNEVPLLQLAKMELPGIGHTLEVREFGRNARPQMVVPTTDAPKVAIDNLPESVLTPSREMMSLVTGGSAP